MGKTEKRSDFTENNKVVQANELIRNATGDLNTVPLKISKLLISCIDTSSPPSDHSVYVSKRDLMNFSNAAGDGALDYMKKQLDTLIAPITLKDENGELERVAFLTKYAWKKNDPLVKCTFHEEVWPYLTDLKKLFTQYDVLDLKDFTSKHSIILYENLLSHTRQFKTKAIRMDVTTLRRLTGTEKKYEKFKDLDKNVIRKAQDEINSNQYLSFLLSYEKEKVCGRITAVTFRLKKRTSFDDTLEFTRYPDRLIDDI